MHVLSIPPAFALSQDQTLKFIKRDQTEARSRRRLSTGLRSPLSMRSAFPNPCQAPAPPLAGQHGQARAKAPACFQKTYTAVKDQTPRATRSRRRDDPAFPRGKEQVPEGTKIKICSRTALDPRTPTPARPKAPPTGRPGRSNRSAAGGPTWRPIAPVSRPLELPRKGPPRGG